MPVEKDSAIDPGAIVQDIEKAAPVALAVVKDIVARVHAAKAATSDGGAAVTAREVRKIAAAELALLLEDLLPILVG